MSVEVKKVQEESKYIESIYKRAGSTSSKSQTIQRWDRRESELRNTFWLVSKNEKQALDNRGSEIFENMIRRSMNKIRLVVSKKIFENRSFEKMTEHFQTNFKDSSHLPQ